MSTQDNIDRMRALDDENLRWRSNAARYKSRWITCDDTLADIHAVMSGKEWTPATLQSIATILERHGYTIAEPE